jgi:hypothetical protein
MVDINFNRLRAWSAYIIFMVMTASFLICPGLCLSEYDYVDINNPFLRKIPIAIPLFRLLICFLKLWNLQVISKCLTGMRSSLILRNLI